MGQTDMPDSCIDPALHTMQALPFSLEIADYVPSTNMARPTTYFCCHFRTHTHTHPFNGPLSGTTRVSRYQKGKSNLDFTEARDSEWQLHQLGHIEVSTLLQTDNHTSTPLPFQKCTSNYSTADKSSAPLLKWTYTTSFPALLFTNFSRRVPLGIVQQVNRCYN